MDQSKSERMAAADNQFGDALNSPEGSVKERFKYIKRKKAQSDNSINNVVTFMDQANDRKYTVSVNASVSGDDVSEELLANLQKSVTAFLNEVHTKL